MQKKKYLVMFVVNLVFLSVLFANSAWSYDEEPDHGICTHFKPCLQAKVMTVVHEGEPQEIAYYESSGDGPTVVMVHGNSSSSWSYVRQLCGLIGQRFHLVAVDLPGHGRSSDAVDPCDTCIGTYNLIAYADILSQVVQNLYLEDAVFVGWSLGGHILLEASQSLSSAAGFMIFGTPPLDNAGQVPYAFKVENPAFGVGAIPNWTNEDLELYVSAFFKPDTHFIPDFFFKDGRRADGTARVEFNQSLAAGLFTPEIGIVENLTVPIAIVHGAQDQFVRLSWLQSLNIPRLWRGQVHVIENAGHAPHWETAWQFNWLLSAFVWDITH